MCPLSSEDQRTVSLGPAETAGLKNTGVLLLQKPLQGGSLWAPGTTHFDHCLPGQSDLASCPAHLQAPPRTAARSCVPSPSCCPPPPASPTAPTTFLAFRTIFGTFLLSDSSVWNVNYSFVGFLFAHEN